MEPIRLPEEFYKNIFLDILFTLLTCGLFNIWIQYRQIQALNLMLNEEKYKFLHWSLFTLLTCGLYHIYHEWRMSRDLAKLSGRDDSIEGGLAIVLSVVGLTIIVDAIQQSRINESTGTDRI